MKLLTILISVSMLAQTVSVAPLPAEQQKAIADAAAALSTAKAAKDTADAAYVRAQQAYVVVLDGVKVANGHSMPDCVVESSGAITRTYREVEVKGGYALATSGVDDCSDHIHMVYDPSNQSIRREYIGQHNPVKTGAKGGTGK